MANTNLTIDNIAREALCVLHQKLRFVGSINRQYDESFARDGAKQGSALRIRLPNQYTVRTGATLNTQDTTERKVTLTVGTQKGVDINFSSAELTLDIDDFSKRILKPAMSVLAAAIEADALSMRKDVWSQANNTAAAITFANVLEGRRLLKENLTPEDDEITALLRTADTADLVDALKGLFNDKGELGRQYREGEMGRAAGMNFMETTHLGTQTRGAGASYLVNDTYVAGDASITVDTGTGTIKDGEIITFANVFRVHPETKVSTGELMQCVVNADYAGGSGTITFDPPLYASGALQNVDALPADNAAITIAGTASTNYGQSMVYHKDAFTFATADLVMPKGVDMASRKVIDGISMRIVRQYDINNDKFPCRVDVYYGYLATRPELAARLANLA